VVRQWRKPLIVLTVKSLLRHAHCISSLPEVAHGRFRRVIPDLQIKPSDAQRILLCSGKIYYDLLKRREKLQRRDLAIVRLEQFYPLPELQLEQALEPYPDATPLFWVQEEPANMGAASFLRVRLGPRLLGRFEWSVIARPESASPATGSSSRHAWEQERLMKEAMGSE
jgi:2-oxoglutarate dehydrogenase E1 component